MKTFRFFVLAVAAILAFSACDSDDVKGGSLYTVTVTSNGNGTVTADPESADPGTNVTITASPDEGYAFEGWLVRSGNVSLADATAAVTSFTMPKGDVELSATFIKDNGLDDTEDILPKISDAAFKEYVEFRMINLQSIENTTHAAWDRNGDGKLTMKEAAQVTAMDLDLFTDSMESLDDLQYFPNIEILIMNDAYDLSDGQDRIGELSKLRVFKANGSELGDLDFSGCPDLNTVICEEAYLDHINLTGCSSLIELNLYYTDIEGELDLSSCTSLSSLDVCLSDITKLDVSGCSDLQKVDASSCSRLKELILPRTSKIKSLYATGTQLTSIDLSGHTELTSLSLSNNKLLTGGLDVSKCTKLRTLRCMYSPIGGTLDLSNCPDMDEVDARDCHLTAVNFSGCSKLWEVYVSNNNLTEIDMSQCGFYVNEDTGQLTNTYTFRLGAQVEPGTEPFDDFEGEIAYQAWAGLDSKYPDVRPREVTIYLREAQREYWEQSQSNAQQNSNDYNGENLGHIKEVIFLAN